MSPSTESHVLEALLFFLYIIAALFFTGLICHDLYQLHKRYSIEKDQTKVLGTNHVRNMQIFSALSVLSFAVLSYHMLNFLIVSYNSWASSNHILVPGNLSDLISGSQRIDIWAWSTSTPLFQNFATVICDDPIRFWWTQQALIFSFGWNVYMAVTGTRLQVPRLWAYFVLDQILPVSFTMNLFFLAMVLSNAPDLRKKWNLPDIVFQMLPVLAYYLSLSLAPSSVGTPYFLFIILSTRLLLFIPYFLLSPSDKMDWLKAQSTFLENGVINAYKATTSTLVLGALIMYIRQTLAIGPVTLAQLSTALHYSPAVSALGYDYLVALGSWVLSWQLRPSSS